MVYFFTSVVDVIYLDYGQSECVPLNRLCSSSPGDIMSRRPMAQYVNLEGVHPVSQIKLHLSFSLTKETVYINNNLMALEQS